MRRMFMTYPGDPTIVVVELSKKEFFDLFHDRTGFQVVDVDTNQVVAQMAPTDDVRCDLCGTNHIEGELIYVMLYASGYVRCPKCFESYRQHCTEPTTCCVGCGDDGTYVDPNTSLCLGCAIEASDIMEPRR